MLILDTCGLIWWTLDPEKLSDSAAKACHTISDEGAFASSISIWEIGIKVKKGKLDIGLSLREYARRLNTLGTLKLIPVDENIWIESVLLEWEHRDPADRVIVATAKINNLPIITKDRIIRDFYEKTIW